MDTCQIPLYRHHPQLHILLSVHIPASEMRALLCSSSSLDEFTNTKKLSKKSKLSIVIAKKRNKRFPHRILPTFDSAKKSTVNQPGQTNSLVNHTKCNYDYPKKCHYKSSKTSASIHSLQLKRKNNELFFIAFIKIEIN